MGTGEGIRGLVNKHERPPFSKEDAGANAGAKQICVGNFNGGTENGKVEIERCVYEFNCTVLTPGTRISRYHPLKILDINSGINNSWARLCHCAKPS